MKKIPVNGVSKPCEKLMNSDKSTSIMSLLK